MGNYEQLKQSVSAVIKTNGNQEITGSKLQNVLLTIISTVGANATFAGIATPATNPGTPDGPVFWIATESGTYSNFGSIELQDGLSVLMWNGSWSSQQIFGVDDVPTAGSNNPVKSSGVAKVNAIEGGSLYLEILNKQIDSNTGVIGSDNPKRALTELIPAYKGTEFHVTLNDGYSLLCLRWKENGDYVGTTSDSSVIGTFDYTMPENGYVRFLMIKAGGAADITPDDARANVDISITRKTAVWKINREDFEAALNEFNSKFNIFYASTPGFIQGRYDVTDNGIHKSEQVTICTQNPVSDSYIKLNDGYKIHSIAWYNSDGTYVGGTIYSDSVVTELTIPLDNYVYHINIRKAGTTSITPSDAPAAIQTFYQLKTGEVNKKINSTNVNVSQLNSALNAEINKVDKISDLLSMVSSFELGSIDSITGVPVEKTDGTRARTKDFVQLDTPLVIIKNEFAGSLLTCEILFYNGNIYKGSLNITKSGGWSVGEEYSYEIPAQQYSYDRIKLVFSGSGFTQTMCDGSKASGYISNQNLRNGLDNSELAISYINKSVFIQGRYDAMASGQLIPSETVSVSNKYYLTGFHIKVKSGYKILSCCKYDTSGTFVEGYTYSDPIISELTIPEDGYLYKFTLRKTDGTAFPASDAYNEIEIFNYTLYNSIQAELKLRDTAIQNVDVKCEQLKNRLDKELTFKPFYLSVPRADGVDGSVDVASLTVASMYSLWDTLIQNYPTFLTSVNLGTDESGDYQLRKITFNYANDATTATAKRKVVMIVNLHGPGAAGDTKQQAYIVYYFIKWLLENREQNELAGWFIMNYQFVFIPIANPWGFENGSRGNYRNVDLARNFDADWEAGESYAGLSKGTSAASEKETQYAQAMIDANTDAYMFIDFHSHMENNSLMQYLSDADGYVYNIGKYAKRYCKITANSNLDNYFESEGGMPKRYAERVKNIPALAIEGAVYDGVGNYTSKAMTDTMRMFLSLFRVD